MKLIGRFDSPFVRRVAEALTDSKAIPGFVATRMAFSPPQ